MSHKKRNDCAPITYTQCLWYRDATNDVNPNRMNPDAPIKWSNVNMLKSPIIICNMDIATIKKNTFSFLFTKNKIYFSLSIWFFVKITWKPNTTNAKKENIKANDFSFDVFKTTNLRFLDLGLSHRFLNFEGFISHGNLWCAKGDWVDISKLTEFSSKLIVLEYFRGSPVYILRKASSNHKRMGYI